jgi:hypothetical protein
MFVVSEEAAAIRAAYEPGGEFSAAMELRRHFPGIIDNAEARGFARTVAGWQPLLLKPTKPPKVRTMPPWGRRDRSPGNFRLRDALVWCTTSGIYGRPICRA